MAASGLDLAYAYRRKPVSCSNFLNSIFMSTVNVAASSLVSAASNAKNELAGHKWSPADHLRFMFMITTWVSVWVLRVLMDFIDWFPFHYSLAPFRRLLRRFFDAHCGGSRSLTYSPPPPLLLSSSSAAAALSSSSALASLSKLDLIPSDAVDFDAFSGKPLGRALIQIFGILNEMPASCGKYQFAMAMAEKIMDENARGGQMELLDVNRTALSAGFARTSSLLYHSLHQSLHLEERRRAGPWPSRIVAALPFASYLVPYLKFLDLAVSAVGTIIPKADPPNAKPPVTGFDGGEVAAEKLGQQLLWMTRLLRDYGAVDEAMLQWSFAAGLASLSIPSNPRVQSHFLKISAMLFRELTRKEMEELITGEVKFRMLSLWLPLLCHARNGVTYPTLTRYEKEETERAVNQVIRSLAPMDQEVILANWLQDYAISASEWPNLQPSYDHWCHSTRQLFA